MRIRKHVVAIACLAATAMLAGCSFFGGNQVAYTHWEPDLSADGRYLVYESDDDGDLELYVRDLETDEVRQLTNNDVPDWSPSWSPDGEFIAFVSAADDNVDIYAIDVSTLESTRLTSDGGDDINPSWGVDGLIYFNSNRTDAWEIYTITPDGSELVKVTQVRATEGG